MIPNLLEATNDYWRKLNELESAYQRGDVSLAEVNTRVAELMAELGQERRATIQFLLSTLRNFWHEQKESVIGLGLLGALSYVWIVVQLS